MTMQLHPCARCRRHVEITAEACPFCSAALTPAQPVVRFVGGRLSRAAVFASATLVSANGCWTSSTSSTSSTRTSATQTTVENQSPASGPGTISGHVHNGHTREVITNFQVTVISADGKRLTSQSDSEGAFAFSGLAPGVYTVEWMQPSANRRLAPEEPKRQTVRVAAGQTAIADIEIDYPVPSNAKMPYGAPPMRGRVV